VLKEEIEASILRDFTFQGPSKIDRKLYPISLLKLASLLEFDFSFMKK
jgi:hypothetical protein